MSYLFIDVQHGLCNRLRALASAAVIAEATGRELVVVWRPDHHCEARLCDLLEYDGLVIEEADPGILSRQARRVYNYMEVEPGARFKEPIDLSGVEGDVYIRSAYTLEGPLRDDRAENRFLQGLRPSRAVLELVQSIPQPSDLALHVRMATGPAFDHLSYESPANWPPERHRELIEWRQKSDISRFVARLDALMIAQPVNSIFVAADLPATYAALIERYGDRVRHLPRDRYDRSARQLQYALADLMLLSAAPMFLASTWSSFSDVAQRLARPGRRTERSGIDF
ncbi:MAG: hypothetical protein Kow0013_12590 [Pararhodobacter sp.]